MKKHLNLALLYVISLSAVNSLFGGEPSVSTFFVINSPSAVSQETDSILTFDSLGNSANFFVAGHNFVGLQDIACSPNAPQHIFVMHNVFAQDIAELLEFDASGRIVNSIGFGSPGEPVSLAFDHAGNFYVAEQKTIFKNGISFASLPPSASIGRLAVDSGGNLYLTTPFVTYQVFHINPLGNVTLFADATQGLLGPYGLAIDSMDNVYVANSLGGPPFILKFDSSGTATLFAMENSNDIIRSMVFDRNDNLYATLESNNKILKFDTAGNSSVFADGSKGLNFPSSITVGTCPTTTNFPPIVDNHVTFDPIKSTFLFTPDATSCPTEFTGIFSFDARLTNISASSLSNLVVEVTELTGGNLVQNANGGPDGVGARLTVPQQDGFSDGMLSPDKFVNVPFSICLTQRQPFTFVVDVLGVVDANADAQARAPFVNNGRARAWALPPE